MRRLTYVCFSFACQLQLLLYADVFTASGAGGAQLCGHMADTGGDRKCCLLSSSSFSPPPPFNCWPPPASQDAFRKESESAGHRSLGKDDCFVFTWCIQLHLLQPTLATSIPIDSDSVDHDIVMLISLHWLPPPHFMPVVPVAALVISLAVVVVVVVDVLACYPLSLLFSLFTFLLCCPRERKVSHLFYCYADLGSSSSVRRRFWRPIAALFLFLFSLSSLLFGSNCRFHCCVCCICHLWQVGHSSGWHTSDSLSSLSCTSLPGGTSVPYCILPLID